MHLISDFRFGMMILNLFLLTTCTGAFTFTSTRQRSINNPNLFSLLSPQKKISSSTNLYSSLKEDKTETSEKKEVERSRTRQISPTRMMTANDYIFLSQKTPNDHEVLELMSNYAESSRKNRRDVYSAANWVWSRRPDRIQENLLTTFQSPVLYNIKIELPLLISVSSFICCYNTFLVQGYQDFSGVQHPALFPDIAFPLMSLPMQAFTLSTGALGLLLAFRTNTSYARWNEARTAWGKVINDSRSIARMGCSWARYYKNATPDQIQRLGEAVCSFSRVLMNRLLAPQEDEVAFREYLATKITDKSYAAKLLNAKHRPTCALAEITTILKDFDLNPIHQVEAEHVVTGLCDALGASERIFTSPVPRFYVSHTARFVAAWLFPLTAALYEPCSGSWNHILMIPATAFIGGFMLAMEELATQMEEPFSILPMEKMTEGSIRTSVMEQVERSQNNMVVAKLDE